MVSAIVFACVGIFIFGLSTWLSPLIAYVIYKLSQSSVKSVHTVKTPLTLDILIPAHNEAESLPATLAALKKISDGEVFARPRLVVGLSNWQGSEAKLASAHADHVISINESGKWRALTALIDQSQADWVALVDSGTVWPEDILIKLAKHFKQSDVVAINPRYSENNSGHMQKVVWALESQLKSLENLSGGPISLHGSTVFYRTQDLKQALEHLRGRDWLNDDVVVPLMLRKLDRSKKIIYASEVAVIDLFPASNISEIKRRKRVLFGNLQWVQSFFPDMLKSPYLLATLALRRIMRMLWAWSIAFVCLGLLIWTPSLAFVFITGAIVLALMPKGRRLFEAFWVSLMMPIYLIFYKSDKVTWK